MFCYLAAPVMYEKLKIIIKIVKIKPLCSISNAMCSVLLSFATLIKSFLSSVYFFCTQKKMWHKIGNNKKNWILLYFWVKNCNKIYDYNVLILCATIFLKSFFREINRNNVFFYVVIYNNARVIIEKSL